MKTIFLALVVLLVGCDDYDHEVRQVKGYCEMVELGYWPAYNEDINCEKVVKL